MLFSLTQTSVHKLGTLPPSKFSTSTCIFFRNQSRLSSPALSLALCWACLSSRSCSNFALISSRAFFSSSFCFLLLLERSQLPPLLTTLEFSLLLMLLGSLEDVRVTEKPHVISRLGMRSKGQTIARLEVRQPAIFCSVRSPNSMDFCSLQSKNGCLSCKKGTLHEINSRENEVLTN